MENRYDKYKDSGIAWIGEIPEHWEIIKIKYILKNNSLKVGPFGSQLSGSDILSKGKYWIYNQRTVLDNNYSSCNSFISNEKYNNLIGFKVSAGDILLTTRGTIGKISRIPSVFNEGVIHPCIIRFNINEKILKYEILRYIFNDSDIVTNQVKYNSNSTTIDVIYSDTLKNIVLAYIPQKEQQSIAAYLDQKCGEIDELITLQEEMITKLQSYKQSVITEAVTKGLNKNVPLKDSGIEWIGKIPEHWKVAKIKSFYNVILGKMVERNNDSNTGDENYLCAANIKWNGVDTEINKKMYFSDIEKEKYLLQYNDVLIMEGGMAGTACLYKNEFSPCYVQNSVNVCRAKKDFNNKFLYYWMYVPYYNGYIDAICNKATIRHYTKEKVQNTPILISSLVEQQSIATYLDQKCSEIDELISIKQQKIEKLKEYKKSLIFECVTGKRKVS